MALGRRKQETQGMWVSSSDLPKSPGHVFYRKRNGILAEAGFDRFSEALCEPYYASGKGRPGVPPGIYVRMLLVGYFEGITSQRGIAWRCGDSLSLREFLGLDITEVSPDHSSLSRIRERLSLEVHQRVFQFVLGMAAGHKLIDGQTVAVDSTTLEASAAMKSIVRRDTGEDWNEYLTRLMQEEGVIDKDEEPTDEERRRFDKQRTDKKVSNEDWQSSTDPDSRIAKMKDGTTHLAYKAENVVDLKTDFILAAEVYRADQGDTTTLVDSVVQAQTHLNEAGVEVAIEEIVGDKGYHAAETLELAQSLNYRTYIPEPQHAHKRRWTDKPAEFQAAVYANRRRVKRAKSKRLQRTRSEVVERTFAQLCETGGARRMWLRTLEKVQKRWILQATARNLGRILRKLFNIGTARALQAAGGLALALSFACLIAITMLRVQRYLLATCKLKLLRSTTSY